MYPVLFHIGDVGLYTYGLFVALGLFTAISVSKKIAASEQIPAQTITDIFFVILISAIIGARLLYVLINYDVYQTNVLEIFKIWNGGLVFFGGFLGATLATALFLTHKGLDLWKMADILSPGIALGHAVGRIGCFFAGCCYGKTCDLFFAVQFSHPESLAPTGVHLHPTQIYMVISNFILFLILILLHRKKRFNGQVFLSYVMLYSLFRFIIEFFRGDYRGNFLFDFISVSQGIGLLVSAAALILLIQRYRSSFHGRH